MRAAAEAADRRGLGRLRPACATRCCRCAGSCATPCSAAASASSTSATTGTTVVDSRWRFNVELANIGSMGNFLGADAVGRPAGPRGLPLRLLVTGAGGFVGGHLVDYLRAEHPEVEIHGVVLPQGGAARGRAGAGVRVVEADLDDPAAAPRARRRGRGPTASSTSPASRASHQSWADPGGTLRTNVLGDRARARRRARRWGCGRRVLVVGSAEEYGTPRARRPAARRGDAAAPHLAVRGQQGGAGRARAPVRRRPAGCAVVLTRTFHHTGPGRGEAFAESSFARQIAEIEAGLRAPVLEVGNLEAVRDFADVRDVVRAYWLLLERGRAGEVYNVCTGRGRRIRERARPAARGLAGAGRGARRPGAAAAVRRARAWSATRRRSWRPPAGSRRSRSTQTLRDLLEDWRARVRAPAPGAR